VKDDVFRLIVPPNMFLQKQISDMLRISKRMVSYYVQELLKDGWIRPIARRSDAEEKIRLLLPGVKYSKRMKFYERGRNAPKDDCNYHDVGDGTKSRAIRVHNHAFKYKITETGNVEWDSEYDLKDTKVSQKKLKFGEVNVFVRKYGNKTMVAYLPIEFVSAPTLEQCLKDRDDVAFQLKNYIEKRWGFRLGMPMEVSKHLGVLTHSKALAEEVRGSPDKITTDGGWIDDSLGTAKDGIVEVESEDPRIADLVARAPRSLLDIKDEVMLTQDMVLEVRKKVEVVEVDLEAIKNGWQDLPEISRSLSRVSRSLNRIGDELKHPQLTFDPGERETLEGYQ